MKKVGHKQITVFSGAVLHDDKILMTLRNEKACEGAHMKWELPGGKAEPGEDAEDAVTREILEETGIKARVRHVLPIVQTHHWEYDWGNQQTFCVYYLCEYLSKEGEPTDHKISSYKWFSFEEAILLDSLPGTAEIIENIYDSCTSQKKAE